MRANSTCRSCGAPIRWGVTEKGQRIPLDPDAVPNGNVVVTAWAEGNPQIRVFAPGDVPHGEPLRYFSHFVTCPQAGEWRRK